MLVSIIFLACCSSLISNRFLSTFLVLYNSEPCNHNLTIGIQNSYITQYTSREILMRTYNIQIFQSLLLLAVPIIHPKYQFNLVPFPPYVNHVFD